MKFFDSSGNEITVQWQQLGYGETKQFVCGHCSNNIASERGFFAQDSLTSEVVMQINICHLCSRPNYFDENNIQHPTPPSSKPINHITNFKIKALFEEARLCLENHAYTACHICCQKVLILICQDRGNPNIKNPTDAIQYLKASGNITTSLIDSANNIEKQFSDEEFKIQPHLNSLELFQFTDITLRLIYELPKTMKEVQNQIKKDASKTSFDLHKSKIAQNLNKGYKQ